MANKRAVDRLTTITTMATGAMRTAPLIIGAMLLLVGGGMLWSAAGHLAQPQTIPPVHSAALWMALVALAVKEGLFRYMLAAAGRLNSSLLIANAGMPALTPHPPRWWPRGLSVIWPGSLVRPARRAGGGAADCAHGLSFRRQRAA